MSKQSLGDRILRGTAYAALEKASVQVMSLATFLVIVSHLSLRDYGLLQLLFAAIGPAVAVSLVGMDRLIVADAAVMRAKEMFGDVQRLFREYFLAVSLMLAISLIAAWFLRSVASQFYNVDVTYYFVALALLFVGQLSMNFSSVVFEAHEKFSFSFFAKFLESCVRTALIFSYFFWFGFSLQTIFWAYIIGKLAAGVLSVPLALSVFSRGTPTAGTASLLLSIFRSHGKWEMASSLVGIFADNAAPWILNVMVSTEGVALYSFMLKINTTLVSALPVRGTLFPILSHAITESRERAAIVASKLKKYLGLMYLSFYAIIFVGIGPATAWFAPQYEAAATLVRVGLLHLFIDVFTMGQSVVFYAYKQQKISFRLTTYGTISTLVLQVLCVYAWGTMGLAIAWLLVGLTGSLYREYLLHTKIGFTLLNWNAFVSYDDYDRLVIRRIRDSILRTFSFLRTI